MFKWAPTWLEWCLWPQTRQLPKCHRAVKQTVLGPKRRVASNSRTDAQSSKVGGGWSLEHIHWAECSTSGLNRRLTLSDEWLGPQSSDFSWMERSLHGWLEQCWWFAERWNATAPFFVSKRQRKRESDGTCGRWRLQSAPWSSRWSTWRCSPSAPCCCPRSGCGPGSPQSARGNSATRWRQSPPGQTESSFSAAGATKINNEILHEVRRLIFGLLLVRLQAARKSFHMLCNLFWKITWGKWFASTNWIIGDSHTFK